MVSPSHNQSPRAQRIWAVASGKGGVGKSLVSSSLAIMLASLHESVVAVDMDLGNANMHSCLGIKYPQKTLVDFLNGSVADLNEVILDTPLFNLKMICGAGGISGTSNPAYTQKLKLLRHIERLNADNVVLDLGAGSSFNTIDFFLSASNHVIVAIPETTSIQSSYNFLRICLFRKLSSLFSQNHEAMTVINQAKFLRSANGINQREQLLKTLERLDPEGFAGFQSFLSSFRPYVIMNMIMRNHEVKLGYGFRDVVKRFLNIDVQIGGNLPYSADIRDSLSAGVPHIIHTPRSRVSQDMYDIAESLLARDGNGNLVGDTIRREMRNFSKSYQQRIVEPNHKDVDPSVNAFDKVSAVEAPDQKRESFSLLNLTPPSWSRIAIDMGTTYTRIYVKGRGVILNEPSLICLDEHSNKPVALGLEAKAMTGRAHSGISIVSPLESSAITDYTDVKTMITEFIKRAKRSAILIRPGVVLTIQPGLTSLEKRAFLEFINELGAREVNLVYQPLAAAIGAGLPVDVPRASMVVNVGGGSVTAIVISISGIVAMSSSKVGGKTIDHHIIRYLRDTHNFNIGEQTAEWVKINYGQAMKIGRDKKIDIRGQDIVMGIPDTLSISTAEIREAIAKPVANMMDTIMDLLERVPPELAGDLVDRGMTLTGGGALLTGFDQLITEKTGIAVTIAANALTATIEGAGRMLDDFQAYQRFFVKDLGVQNK